MADKILILSDGPGREGDSGTPHGRGTRRA